MNINDKDLLFYDIEVYKYNSFAVFKDINKNTVGFFSNKDGFDGLQEFIQGKVLVGYNNKHYDNKVLYKMAQPYPDGINEIKQRHIKQLNDRIIAGEGHNERTVPNKSYDCFQQIDVGFPSLKKIEGNIGKMILETDIGFDIDRELTDEELETEINYCSYDVSMTVDVYKERKANYFEIKEQLVDLLGNDRALNWNTTTIATNILLQRKQTAMWSTFLTRLPDGYLKGIDPQIVEMWTAYKPKKKSYTMEDFDNEIEFGFGGIHSVHKNIKDVKGVKLLDVASMYPHIILNIKALPHDALEKYKGILNERIEIKHKDKKKSDALKLVLNSVYGNLKNKYSPLLNEQAAVGVCVYGQVALYTLAKRLSETCTIIQMNTDGVAVVTDSDEYIKVWHDWEQEFNLTLEEDKFDRLIQKDVNNYIAIEPDGSIKVKGGDVSRYHGDSKFKNNNARIIDIAIVDYLVYGTPVLETLKKNTDQPHLYQYILQAGRTYKGTFDSFGSKLQKVNRVFAMKQKTPEPYVLYKVKENVDEVVNEETGEKTKEVTESWARFPDAPENMMLWNDEVYQEDGTSNIPNFAKTVDINHYYQIITKKLERWCE
jgi:putative sterol carrier protein